MKNNPTNIDQYQKDWKLTELLAELQAVQKLAEMENSELLIRYRAFLFNEIWKYLKEKMVGTDYEWK